MVCTVVNIRDEPCDEYCGRGSIYGNPFEIGVDGTREQVIARHKKWFALLLKDAKFIGMLETLKGKKLGCFCKNRLTEVSCHCDTIAEYVNTHF